MQETQNSLKLAFPSGILKKKYSRDIDINRYIIIYIYIFMIFFFDMLTLEVRGVKAQIRGINLVKTCLVESGSRL